MPEVASPSMTRAFFNRCYEKLRKRVMSLLHSPVVQSQARNRDREWFCGGFIDIY